MSESGERTKFQMQTPLGARWWLLDAHSGRILDSAKRPYPGVPIKEDARVRTH